MAISRNWMGYVLTCLGITIKSMAFSHLNWRNWHFTATAITFFGKNLPMVISSLTLYIVQLCLQGLFTLWSQMQLLDSLCSKKLTRTHYLSQSYIILLQNPAVVLNSLTETIMKTDINISWLFFSHNTSFLPNKWSS